MERIAAGCLGMCAELHPPSARQALSYHSAHQAGGGVSVSIKVKAYTQYRSALLEAELAVHLEGSA